MPQHHDVSRRSICKRLSRPAPAQPRRQLFFLAVIILMLTGLACALNGGTSQSAAGRIAGLTRLPTFTRTPLPTFTSTATPSPLALEMSIDAAGLKPTSANPPIHTAPEPITSESAQLSPTFTPAPISMAAPDSLDTPIATPVVTPQSLLADAAPISPTSTIQAISSQGGTTAVTENLSPSPSPLPIPATATSTPSPTYPATATAVPPTATVTPSSTPSLPPTATPLPAGWLFSGVRVSPDPYDDGFLLHGEVINNTGSGQELSSLTGTFYDAQGQIVAEGNTTAYWPIAAVPHGGRLPFELVVLGLESVGNFELHAEAEPSPETLSQEVEFVAVTPSSDSDNYCLSGQLHNRGEPLASYLIIMAVLYDSDAKVINHNDNYEPISESLSTDQAKDFKICVDSLDQEVDRYELRAWGR